MLLPSISVKCMWKNGFALGKVGGGTLPFLEGGFFGPAKGEGNDPPAMMFRSWREQSRSLSIPSRKLNMGTLSKCRDEVYIAFYTSQSDLPLREFCVPISTFKSWKILERGSEVGSDRHG